MLSLTSDQELTKLYQELTARIDTIRTVYFKAFLDRGLCDIPSKLVKVRGNISLLGSISEPNKPKERQDRQALLKEMSEIMTKIKAAQASLASESKDQRQSELTLILNTEIVYYYVSTVLSGPASDGAMWNQAKLTISGEPVRLKYILDTLMPKYVVLDQMDSLLVPAKAKLDKLIEKAKKDSKYENVKFVAQEAIDAAAKAREQIIKATSVIDGLQQAETAITAVYTENNNAIFAEHRGNPIVNASIEILRQLAGYLLFVLTYPARLYDNERTKAYVNSWFEKRQTESFKIFGTFKEGMQAQNLAETAGLAMNYGVSQDTGSVAKK